MIPDKHLKTLVGAIVAIWALSLILAGIAAPLEMLQPFSTVTGVLPFVLLAFDKWLWRIPFLHPWFVEVPNLRGVWRVEIRSTWKDPETGQTPGPIEGYMVIRQTYSTISMRLFTRESSSKLTAGWILKETDGKYLLTCVYNNESKLPFRDRSPIHYGSYILRVVGDPPQELSGHYWTDRGTQGEMILTERKRKFPDDFETAFKAYQATA